MPTFRIQQISEVAPHADGNAIVLRAETVRESGRTDVEIAVTTDLAPTMALALLATTAQARSRRDELEPALDVRGAAVVRSSSSDKVRLQMLFDKGAVLPVELSLEAAEALNRGLAEYLGSPRRRLAQRKG
jgi:hypothetical protein